MFGREDVAVLLGLGFGGKAFPPLTGAVGGSKKHRYLAQLAWLGATLEEKRWQGSVAVSRKVGSTSESRRVAERVDISLPNLELGME
jgi:hypothetical protein